ncbi:MAG: DctP family TRAP transporter solute-binding subunit [Oligoflexales bacterium]
MNKIPFYLCFFVLCATVYKISLNDKVYQISLGHNMPVNSSIHRGATYFKEIVERDSHNKIHVKIHPNQELGTDVQMIKMVQDGKLSISITPTSKITSLAPQIRILDIPYLFNNRKKIHTALDGPFGKKISQKLLKHGLSPVSYWESGFKQMISKSRLHGINDFSGKIFRVMQSHILKSQVIHLHAFPKFIDFHSLHSSFKSNEFDIQENSLSSFSAMKLYETHKHISLSNHGYIAYISLMSDVFFKDIPKNIKNIIEKSLLRSKDFQRKDSLDNERLIIKKMKEKNIHISIMDQTFKASIFKKMSGLYFRYRHLLNSFKDLINPDIIKSLENNIAIGVNISFSLEAKDSALAIIRGAELAVSEINHGDDFLKKKLVLDIRDHGGFPANGIHNIKELSKDPLVVSLLGGMHSPVILKEAKFVQENKIPYLIPWAAASNIISKKNPYHFRFSVRDEYAGKALLKEATQHGENISLILEDTPWGRGNFSAISKEAKSKNINLIKPYWFKWGESSFSQIIQYLENSSSDVIIYIGNSPEGVHLIKKITQLKKPIPIVSHWGILGGRFWTQVQKELKNVPLVFLQTYIKPDNKKHNTKAYDFFKKYTRHFSTQNRVTPAPFATIHTYELIKMLSFAIQKGLSYERNSIKKHLRSMQTYDGLFRLYHKPFFNIEKQDALSSEDINFAKFSKNGDIVGK